MPYLQDFILPDHGGRGGGGGVEAICILKNICIYHIMNKSCCAMQKVFMLGLYLYVCMYIYKY